MNYTEVAPTSKSVSIIIPTWHSPTLSSTLSSIKRQIYDLDKVEILVVGQDKFGIASSVDGVSFINADSTVSEARTLGIQASTGRYLVFLDSDCIASEGWLKRLVRRLEEGHDVVGGGIAVHGGSYWATGYNISTFHEFLTSADPGERLYLPTLNLAMQREVAENVGILDPELRRAEDVEWTIRMKAYGYSLYFDPQAQVYHYPKTNLLRIWKKWFSTGYYSWKVRRRHSSLLHYPKYLKYPLLILLGTIPVSLLASGRIFLEQPELVRYIYLGPLIFLTKIAWCLGAASAAGASWLETLCLPKSEHVT